MKTMYKIFSLIICSLLITSSIPLTVFAGEVSGTFLNGASGKIKVTNNSKKDPDTKEFLLSIDVDNDNGYNIKLPAGVAFNDVTVFARGIDGTFLASALIDPGATALLFFHNGGIPVQDWFDAFPNPDKSPNMAVVTIENDDTHIVYYKSDPFKVFDYKLVSSTSSTGTASSTTSTGGTTTGGNSTTSGTTSSGATTSGNTGTAGTTTSGTTTGGTTTTGGVSGGVASSGTTGDGSDVYIKGKGLVPVCNKGKLVEVPVLDADGKPVMVDGPKDTKVQLTEWRLGSTKCDFNQVMTLINRVIRFLLIDIATPLAAIIFCYAGFKYLTSGGSEESTKKAKHMLINVVVGYIIALGAWLIINTILTSLGFNGPTFLG